MQVAFCSPSTVNLLCQRGSQPLAKRIIWNTATFRNEIMTIAALQDMGYQTIYIDQYAFG